MVVTIEKYFEIYIVPHSVIECKNYVGTFRNTVYSFFYCAF